MCGICGIYGGGAGIDAAKTARAMCGLLVHRGPDGEGFYSRGGMAMAMRRLAIIDLKTGDQPVYNEDRSLAVVLNGEIYNYVELRGALESAGHRFTTSSDTEVIVHLFEEHGERAFAMLNGFFAFALHDARSGELYIARDRWGIKPLYYCAEGGTLAFASEVNAFRALGREFDLDRGALNDYLSCGYLPGDETLLAGVRLLPQGCFMKADASGPGEPRRYHTLSRDPRWGSLSFEEAREIYFAKVDKALRISLRSDVPVGLFLSGGLDSNILLHEARRHISGLISTYTVGVESPDFDESSLVRRLAADSGLKASFLDLTPGWIAGNFDRLAEAHGSLAVTPAFLAAARLSEAAARDLKVVLSGSGGDELLLGYPTYRADLLWPLFNRLPRAALKAMGGVASLLPHGSARIPFAYKLARFAGGAALPFEKAHHSWRTLFGAEEQAALLKEPFAPGERAASWAYERAFAEAPAGWHPLERASFADTRVWLPNMGLLQVDTFTMRSSLELRPPLLENELSEFLFSLPLGLKMRGGSTKDFFRRCYKDKLPSYITGQAKMGFHLPMAQWLRGELKSFAAGRLFDDPASAVFFRRAELERLFNEHLSGRDHSFKILALICFLGWRRASAGFVRS